jgi:hypothetical protein
LIPIINSFGTGGAVVGELLTVQGGVAGTDFSRPATFYTSQIRAQSVTLAGATVTATLVNTNTTITVTAVTSGAIAIGAKITGTGIPANTYIVSQTDSTETDLRRGRKGHYVLSVAATSSSSQTLTAVSTGQLGPPSATVYLSGSTGHGRRPMFVGKTDANGVLIPTVSFTGTGSGTNLTASSVGAGTIFPGATITGTGVPAGTIILSQTSGTTGGAGVYVTNNITTSTANALTASGLGIIEAGVLTHNPTDPTIEPIVGDQRDITLPGTWLASGTQVTISSAVSSAVLPILRVGMELSGVGDNNAQGIKFGSIITAISGAVVTFTSAAVNAGTNQNVRFILNSQRFVFTASFANNSSTITASATLPTWVQPGMLISGYGIVGGGDPKGSSAANTTITAIAGTTITISQNTTAVVTGTTNITINPFLAGVAANISFEPVGLHLKDAGVYKTLPTSSASVRGAVDKGVTITPPASLALIVGFGTDNTVALEAWASSVRSVVATQAVLGNGVGAGIKAILPPGTYLSSTFLNFVGMAWPGLFMDFSGATLHSVAAGKVAIDFRATRFVRIEHPTVMGDQYFPPRVGICIGRYDARQGNDLNITSPTCWGYYSLAGIDTKDCESTVLVEAHVQNSYTPDLPPVPNGTTIPYRVPAAISPPVFGITVDGWNHYPVVCEVAAVPPTGPWPNGGVWPADTPTSFNDICFVRASAMCASGIAWVIGSVNGLRVMNGYGQTAVGPGILYFGDASMDADLEIHMENHNGQSGSFSAANTAGIQDAIMVTAASNPILQFDSRYVDYLNQAANSIFAYDVERYYGLTSLGDVTPGGLFTSHRADIDIKGFGGLTAQLFDYMHDLMSQQSSFGGAMTVGGVLYTSLPHLMSTPAAMTGEINLGDTEWDLNRPGYIQGDSMYSRGSVTANTDMTATGWVYAQTGLSLGPLGGSRASMGFNGTSVTLNTSMVMAAAGVAALPNYANDAAALAGGVVIGGLYRNGSVVQIRVT